MDDDPIVAADSKADPENDAPVRAGWRALFNFTSRAHAVPLVLGLLLSVASGIIIPALAIFLGKIFDSFTDFGGAGLSGSKLIKKVSVDGIALVGLGSASWLLNGGYFMFWLVFGELQAKNVRDKLFDGMLEKDMEWYDMRKAGVGAIIPRLQTQIRELQIATSQPLGFAIQYTVTTIAALSLAFYTAWSLTLVTLATVPPSAVVLAWISARLQPGIDAQLEELAQASKFANNAISAIDTVKCFNGQDFELWQYKRAIKRAAQCYLVQARTNALQIGFVRLVTLGMFVQGFWYGSHLIDTGNKNPGQVLTAFWGCLMATQAFEQILPQMIVLEKGRVAGATLKAMLVKMERGRNTTATSGQKTPRYCDGDIHVRDVSFAYPSRPSQPALDSANFFFPAGETTFVIGKSGSGKSTLGNLLLQFYNPKSGSISIDGEQIQFLDRSWLRNNITLVQQQNVLFNETIFKNIALGRRDHSRVTKGEVSKSIEMANLQHTISEFPEGLDTLVGRGGNAMSGGQRQRVAIARARLRDTPILILDEATSALDHTNRFAVLEAIRVWRRGKTTIIITHDISQIRPDDYAYVLDQGKVVQEGYRHALEQSKRGLFSSFVEPSVVFPNPTSLQASHAPRRRSSSVGTTRESSRTSLISLDSMEIRFQPRESYIPTVFQPSTHYRHSKRVSSALISPLSPAIIQPSQLSNPRASMVLQSRNSMLVRPYTSALHQPFWKTEMARLDVAGSIVGSGDTTRSASISLVPPPSNFKRSSKLPKLLRALPRKKRKLSPAEKARQVSSIKKILSTVWPTLAWKQQVVLICGFFFALLHAAATPVFSYLFAKLLGTFYLPTGRSEMALKWSLSVLGVAIGDAVASYFMHYLLESCGQAWVDSLRIEAMKRILDQPHSWFDRDKNSLSRLTECLDRNAEEMRNLVGRFAGFVFVAAVMVAIAFIWSLILCWKLTLVGLAAGPFMYAVTRGFEAVSGSWEGKSNDAGEAASSIFTEIFSNIKTVRAMTLEGYFHRKYAKATEHAMKVGLKRSAYSGFFFGLSDASIIYITALIFYYGSLLASSYRFPLQNILTVFTMLLFSIANANALIAFIPQISSSRDTATRLLRLAHLPYLTSHEHTGHVRLPSPFPGPIAFRSLSFTYPTRPSAPILTSLSLSLPLPTSTALVGSSGSGKSTLASLLLSLYASPPGTLSIANHDITHLHTPTLRSRVAFISQSPELFPTTIAQNIAYALPPDSPLTSLPNIRLCAQAAAIDDFISSLPEGYDTPVGDGGLGLSGGQVQRIAIARALVRRPSLIIMDEPTSSLDAQSAEVVRDTVGRLVARGGVSVIVATHSVQMMRAMGHVVVLDGGRVVEEGAYEEVVGRMGVLWRLIGGGGEGDVGEV